LKQLAEKKYVRMSEREVESFDQIKDSLIQNFYDVDPPIRKLTCTIMSKLLI
jgi:hypothetical protein